MNDTSTPSSQTEEKSSEEPVAKYSISGGFVGLLANLNVSVAVTSYQSGRLYLLGRNPKGGLMVNEQFFHKAMGLHYQDDTLYMATLANIYRMQNILRPHEVMDEQFTDCFVPRTAHLTGVLDAHDVGLTGDDRLLFVNTRYNCIAEVSDTHAFRPWWKPKFISAIVAEDRCHLNGMAMHDGSPKYVTAVSKSDTIDGWRDRRADGGIIIDVEKDEIVCDGLSMPHSPRMYQGKLWVLNSGTGELGWIDMSVKDPAQRFSPVTFCPGFVRGLAFSGKFAFVGLSKPRYERFEGLALDKRLADADSEPWCGVQVIDLNSGSCVQWFRIDGKIGELYDVEILPGIMCARSYGFLTNDVLGIITMDDHDL
ncbi:MAG: TIGR03032 family protein [Pseudomonadota bacterium]